MHSLPFLGRSAGEKGRLGWLSIVAWISGVMGFCHLAAWGADSRSVWDAAEPCAALELQHPIAGAVLPADMPAPVVLWATNVPGVGSWAAGFKAGGQQWSFEGIHALWRPPETEWCRVKEASKEQPIELTVAGYEPGAAGRIRARGSVRFAVCGTAVRHPLFFRDVNLPFIEAVKDPSTIRWRFGTLDRGTPPPVVLENLPVCGNCHSFSRDGAFLAMDVDYGNNKGSYVIAKTAPNMVLTTNDVITWDDYRREDGQDTLGLLSQISPDGRYVLSTVKDLSVFMPKPDLAFSQLFFPFLGILAVYDRETKQFSALPGADDPAWVQSNPTWSPDGQWVVFARTRAVILKRRPAQGRLLLTREEDEEIFQQTREYRYDLYRVPFNGGKGGRAEPLRGASRNGRSNYFPKYSPDGRWIVFCQAANYMLLQPDSELFLIPADGGEPRRLACNLGRMNSWHSWSPDGRWLVFASKAHSDYTQLYLSRIQANGEASPPVWLAHMTEPGRAANIPEFVSLPAEAIVGIRHQFLEDDSYVRVGSRFLRAGETNRAIGQYRAALSMNPDNTTAHRLLGQLLKDSTNKHEALQHLEAVVRLDAHDPLARFVLGSALASTGHFTNAIVQFEAGIRELPVGIDETQSLADQKQRLPELLHHRLGLACGQVGDVAGEEQHLRQAVRLAPGFTEAHYHLGILFLRSARLAEAEGCFAEAVRLAPAFGRAHNCLGIVRQRLDRKTDALASFQKAVQCDPSDWQARLNLARAYLAENRREPAAAELREVLRLNPSCQPARQALTRALESGPAPSPH